VHAILHVKPGVVGLPQADFPLVPDVLFAIEHNLISARNFLRRFSCLGKPHPDSALQIQICPRNRVANASSQAACQPLITFSLVCLEARAATSPRVR